MRPDEIMAALRSLKLAPEFKEKELRNRVELRREFVTASSVPGLAAHVAVLLKYVEDGNTDIVAYKEQNIVAQIEQRTGELRSRVHIMLEILSAWYGNDEQQTVYVGMPRTALQDPASFDNAFKDIVVGLDDLSRRVTGLGLKVEGVRAGSAWIQLLMEAGSAVAEGVATASPFAFIVGFFRLLFWCRSEHLRIEAEEVRTAGLKNQQTYLEGMRGINLELTRNAAAALIEQYQTAATSEAANENITVMMNLITTMQGHIDSGARLAVTANASRSVKRQLPQEAGGYLPGFLPGDVPIPQHALPPAIGGVADE